MIKRFLVAICLFLSFISFAQEGTASPYSFYGLGETSFKGTVDSRSMAGLSVIPDSMHINLQNPAFYPYLKYTSLATGVSYSNTKLISNTDEEKAKRTTLDYIAVGIPMGKFGAGFGLMPYTAVGYKIQVIDSADAPAKFKQYRGSGGLNKAFFGAGYQISKHLSVGAEFGYYFGSIETSSLISADEIQYGTQELNDSKVSGAGFNAGFAYNGKVGKNLTFSASAMFSPESNLNLSNDRTISTVHFLSDGQTAVIDQNDVDVADTKVKLPSKVSFGGAIGDMKKWMVGTEITFQQSNDTGNRFNDINNADFKNGFKYSLGGYFIPNYTSFSQYWKKITYRGGFKYEETGLVINNKSINDAGMTLGLGLPLGGTITNLNFGFEYGKRGTKDAGLVEENYFNFTIGLSFNDRWFVKRKYD